MKRIDAARAQQIEGKRAEMLKSESPSPGTEAALRRLIDGLISGEPNYEEMNPQVAAATRDQLRDLHADLAQLGLIQSIRFLRVANQGEDVYRDARYLHRDFELARATILKLEMGYAKRGQETRTGTNSPKWSGCSIEGEAKSPVRAARDIGSISYRTLPGFSVDSWCCWSSPGLELANAQDRSAHSSLEAFRRECPA
jgi:hypothetical protein